jgi:lycopene cyclase domain-containing protein
MSFYLMLDILAVAGPLALSFDRRGRYVRRWPQAFAATLLTAVPFIAWDILMTRLGAWSFAADRVYPMRFFGLPIEEMLFFIVVPFSCLFLYEVLGAFTKERHGRGRRLPWLALAAALACLVPAAGQRLYTATIVAAAALFLAIVGAAVPRLLASSRFWLAILISYAPFLAMNGALTAKPVVLYAPRAILGIRLVTIPIEDFLYSFVMLGMAIALYEWIGAAIVRRRAIAVC